GGDERFRLVVYTLDEATYSRELAPLAGHYPAVRLGSPWWFHDSVHGIERYLGAVVEIAGFAKLAGFVDDARSLPMLYARHDVWRRTTCDWLARLEVRGLLDADASERWARWLAHGSAWDASAPSALASAATSSCASNAPRSAAAPRNGRPTSRPASMAGLSGRSLRKSGEAGSVETNSGSEMPRSQVLLRLVGLVPPAASTSMRTPCASRKLMLLATSERSIPGRPRTAKPKPPASNDVLL